MEEISKFDSTSEELSETLHSCTSTFEMIDLSKRQDINKINELEIELEDTLERMINAKATKQKEIENIDQKIRGSGIAAQSLEGQMQEIETRIAEQQMYIASLRTKIADAEYVSKRRNSFSKN